MRSEVMLMSALKFTGANMFANFAAKRHLTGPLRAVSPVAEDDNEIDWRAASQEASSTAAKRSDVLLSDNARKLNAYFKKVFKAQISSEKLSFKNSCQLIYVEAISLLIPTVYIGSILGALSVLILLFVEPIIRYFDQGQLLEATVCVLSLIHISEPTRPY